MEYLSDSYASRNQIEEEPVKPGETNLSLIRRLAQDNEQVPNGEPVAGVDTSIAGEYRKRKLLRCQDNKIIQVCTGRSCSNEIS